MSFGRDRHPDDPVAWITYVGVDSLYVPVGPSQNAAAMRNGRWAPSHEKASFTVKDMADQERTLVLITLAPQPTYGRFLQAVRDLRGRGTCNILIREGRMDFETMSGALDASNRDLLIPALVLCGHAIGDAGFEGTLPHDRRM